MHARKNVNVLFFISQNHSLEKKYAMKKMRLMFFLFPKIIF